MLTINKLARATWRNLKNTFLRVYLNLHRIENENVSVGSKAGTVYLLNINYHWYYSWVDYSLGRTLENRGNKVKVFLCDGMPYCERLTVTTPKPVCSDCVREAKGWCAQFGLKYQLLSSFVSRQEQDRINSYVGSLQVERLFDETRENIPVGEYARRNFLHYSKGVFNIDKSNETIARGCLSAALITKLANERFLRDSDVARVITPNGKFIQSGLIIEEAKKRAFDYYTWDIFTQGGAAVFAKNSIALDQKIALHHHAEIFSSELTEKMLSRLGRFYEQQKSSKNTPFRYYNDPIVGCEDIRNIYNIPTDTHIITIFTNVEWDSTAMGLDVAFKDMFDFAVQTINQFSNRKDVTIVVRCHPGEVKVPCHLRTRALFDDRLRAHYKGPPPNTVLIGGESEVSSYSLAAMSRMAMVYSSTIGLELALAGIKPWVASSVYYSGLGFTNDIRDCRQTAEDFERALVMRVITNRELQRARKFAYAVKFRRLFRHPLYRRGGRFTPFPGVFFGANNTSQEAKTLRNIGDFVEDKRSEFDLGEPVNI